MSQMQEIIAFFKSRGLAIVRDDALPNQRATLVAAAAECDPETVNQILSITGGHLFVALSPERVLDLSLQPMVQSSRSNGSHKNLNNATSNSYQNHLARACVSVEAREGVSTGISAYDRSVTLKVLAEEPAQARNLVKPGHIFPVEVRSGGLLVKNSLPEGALDLIRLAGWSDAALFVDLIDEQGELMTAQQQEILREKENIPLFTLSMLTRHRLQNEQLVKRVAEAELPTKLAGMMRSVAYKSSLHGGEHLALVKGELDPSRPVLTRVQPESTLGDVFGGPIRSSRDRIQSCLNAIGERGSGVLLYLRRPDSGQMRMELTRSTDVKPATSASMMREYGLGAQILRDLGVRKIELLTSTQRNLVGLKPFGIEIVSQHEIPEFNPITH